MAKVVGPLHSSEARGRVGALIYNTWRGIHYVKEAYMPATQYSDAQVALRLLAAAATTSWQAISNEQRAAWAHYANQHPDIAWTGKPERKTAYNWYVRINVRRQLLGGAILETPPIHQVSHTIKALIAYQDSELIIWEWTVQTDYPPGDLYYDVWLVGPHSPGASPGVKMTKRTLAADMTDGSASWEWPAAGTYTAFIRPLHSNGTVAGWTKITTAVT